MWKYRRHRMFQVGLSVAMGAVWLTQYLHFGFDPFAAAQTFISWVWIWEP